MRCSASSLLRVFVCATVALVLWSFTLPSMAARPPKPSPVTGSAQPSPPPLGEGNSIPPQTQPPSQPQGNTPSAGGAPGGGQTPPKSDPKFLTIDLMAPGDFVRDPGTYTLKVINKVPGSSYTTSSKIISKQIAAAFDLSAFQVKPPPNPKDKAALDASKSCQSAIDALVKPLQSMACESSVSLLRATYKSRLKQQSGGACMQSDIDDSYAALIAQTESTETEPLPALVDGDELTVTVTRLGIPCNAQDDPPTKIPAPTSKPLGTWHYSFGKIEAQWLTLYGFNFAAGGNQDYFSKTNSGTNPTTYTITRKAGRGGKAFSPSVYFMRLPGEDGATMGRWAGWRQGDYFGGITAGLGFDFDNPTVFLGYGFGWGYNLLATAGVVMHKENRLNGQYSAGDVVSENLTSDQLTQSTYKPQAYIGLAFRFGSNPFKKSNTDIKPKADTTPKADTAPK